MPNDLPATEAYAQMIETLQWMKEPRTIKEFQDKLSLGRVSARNWIDGWCERGWIKPAGYIRMGGRGRPALAFMSDEPPKNVLDLLNQRYQPRQVEKQGDPWAFTHELQVYFASPRTIFDYRQRIAASWPTAKAHLTRWIEGGFLFDAGLRRAGHAPPAQLYCADTGIARFSVLRSALAEYERWRTKHPDADPDTWER